LRIKSDEVGRAFVTAPQRALRWVPADVVDIGISYLQRAVRPTKRLWADVRCAAGDEEPKTAQVGPLDEVLDGLRSLVPGLVVECLAVTHAGDDDNVYFRADRSTRDREDSRRS
jgi:hypothetical protein